MLKSILIKTKPNHVDNRNVSGFHKIEFLFSIQLLPHKISNSGMYSNIFCSKKAGPFIFVWSWWKRFERFFKLKNPRWRRYLYLRAIENSGCDFCGYRSKKEDRVEFCRTEQKVPYPVFSWTELLSCKKTEKVTSIENFKESGTSTYYHRTPQTLHQTLNRTDPILAVGGQTTFLIVRLGVYDISCGYYIEFVTQRQGHGHHSLSYEEGADKPPSVALCVWIPKRISKSERIYWIRWDTPRPPTRRWFICRRSGCPQRYHLR